MFETLADVYYNRGLALARDGRMTAAVQVLRKAAALAPESWQVRNILGLCLYSLGDWEAAAQQWQHSISLQAEDNQAHRYMQSLQDADSVDVQARYNQALDLARAENYQGAVRILIQKDFPCFSNVAFINLLGLCQYARGKKREALKIWMKALTIDREHPLTTRYLSLLQAELPERRGFFAVVKKFLSGS